MKSKGKHGLQLFQATGLVSFEISKFITSKIEQAIIVNGVGQFILNQRLLLGGDLRRGKKIPKHGGGRGNFINVLSSGAATSDGGKGDLFGDCLNSFMHLF